MLTMRQLFAVSGQSSGAALRQAFPLRPLSIKSVISAYEQQKRAYFVTLVSPKILLSDQVRSFDDLVRLAPGPLGQPDQSEIQALTQYLEASGVYLRYISKDLRTATLIGTVPSLVNFPAAPVTAGNFVTIQDEARGYEARGAAMITTGAIIVAVGLAVSKENPAAGEVIVVGGLVVVVFGLLTSDRGTRMDINPPPPPPKPSSDNIDTPNDLGDPSNPDPNGDIEIPSAVAYGEPEKGINEDTLLQQLGTSTLDTIINDLPIGWDPDTGTPLAGIGGVDLGGGGGGAGDGGFGGGGDGGFPI